MSKIDLAYTVPVTVRVDTDTGRVTDVIVWCDQVGALDRYDAENHDTGGRAQGALVAAAEAIAEFGDDWPVWTFG